MKHLSGIAGGGPRIVGVRLGELVAGLDGARVVGDSAVEIVDLAYDSRKVRSGTLFFCVPGEKVDGHEFGRLPWRRGRWGSWLRGSSTCP